MSDVVGRLNRALSGRYRVERLLGEGGMATVYLADDLRHSRKVALKVLRPELAAVVGSERFLAEIRTTASLQHPHILPLFDSGEADGFLFYVMPHVEGESLRQRLDRERQLPVDEAVRIATAVASALAYAHERDVIHRDIKPANILVHGGQPVLADFGIALALGGAGGSRLTETGLSLGTPHYMSPEQATGDRGVGPATDIYALGCVLYEMLVGEPPHTGSTPQAILGRIIAGRPAPIRELRRSVPAHVEAAVAKALEKIPADRFATVEAFARALADVNFTHSDLGVATAAGTAAAWRRASIALATTSAVFAGLAVWTLSRPQNQAGGVARYQIVLPDSAPLAFSGPAPIGIWQSALAMARDGSTLAYVAESGGTTALYVRDMATVDGAARRLDSTEGAYSPFYSPDGEWLGFFSGDGLRKIRVGGGASISLAASTNSPGGGSWLSDGRIFVASSEGRLPMIVPDAGGAIDSLPLEEPRWGFRQPSVLPGEEWLVGTMWSGQLALFSLLDGTLLGLTPRGPMRIDSMSASDMLVGSDPTYVSTGHLLYLSAGEGDLIALPFDPVTHRVLGDPFPVMGRVRTESGYGFGHVAVAETGFLAFAPGANASRGHLAWTDEGGRLDTIRAFPRGSYNFVRLSPDGGRALVSTVTEQGRPGTVDILELASGRRESVDIMPGAAVFAWNWLSDGTGFLAVPMNPVTRIRLGVLIYSLSDRTTRSLGNHAVSWPAAHPAGNHIVATDDSLRGRIVIPVDGGDVERGTGVTYQAAFSPDGRWLAYATDNEIRVRRYPFEGQTWPLVQGVLFDQPMWARDGDEIYYKGVQEIWRVAFQSSGGASGGPLLGDPELFARGPYVRTLGWAHDIAPDGRVLAVVGSPETSTDRIEVVTGFTAEIERLDPRNNR